MPAASTALHSPATGVVDYRDRHRGDGRATCERTAARIVTGCEVRTMTPRARSVTLGHSAGRTEAAKVVLCAGPWADRLAVAAGADPDPRVVPFRGAYLQLKPERAGLVRSNIYPVPDPDLPFLGMHLTRDPHGEVLLGPTALLVGARDAYRLRRVVPRDLVESLRLARNAADDAAILANRARPRCATRSASVRSSPSAGATSPSCRREDVERSDPRRRPRPGDRPRRLAGRRLRRLRDRARRPRPQRALPRRHLVAGARRADRRSARRGFVSPSEGE